MTSKKYVEYVLVAAVDFGTTYSGYAFQLKNDFEADPLSKIRTPIWNAGCHNLMSFKTPTVLLLRPDKSVHSFGYSAENEYSELALEGNHKDWYYFRLFKMKLHEESDIKQNLMLEDETGKPLKAMTVFAHSIRYLKDHLLDTLQKQGIDVKVNEILWVLTVPAIWRDSAKIFMREAAAEAGIPHNCLKIALEPEAASVYCQKLPVEKVTGACGSRVMISKPGSKYMVVDIGGGTADITVHEKLPDGTLKELHQATGGGWGGSTVNSAFYQFLVKLIGGKAMHQFMTKYKAEYLEVLREFEAAKRTISTETNSKVTLRVPVCLNQACADANGDDIPEILSQSNCPYHQKVTWRGDKFRMEAEIMKDFFGTTIDEIVQQILSILQSKRLRGIDMILLVGGFADSPFVQQRFKDVLKDSGIRVIIPAEAGLSVLKGAVMYGQCPGGISQRVIRYSYGVLIDLPFDSNIHPPEKKFYVDGEPRCKDLFWPFMEAGTTVCVGHEEKQNFKRSIPWPQSDSLEVYSSTGRSPQFVTEKRCTYMGKVIEYPKPTQEPQIISATFIFGETELFVEAVDEGSGIPCTARFGLAK